MTGKYPDIVRRLKADLRSTVKPRATFPAALSIALGVGLASLTLATTPSVTLITADESTVQAVQYDQEIAIPEPTVVMVFPSYRIVFDENSPTGLETPVPVVEHSVRAPLSNRSGLRTELEVSPAATPTPRQGVSKHVVAEGETVSGIADSYNISIRTVVDANGIKESDSLAIGQELRIPPFSGTLYTIAEGDTIIRLATDNDVIPEDIVAANRIENSDELRVGQEIVIPVGASRESAGQAPADQASSKVADKPVVPSSYTVEDGNTLLGIAGKFGISTDSLVWSNPALVDGDSLQIGQTLTIPPVSGVLHTVQSGDSLFGVADRYGVSEGSITKANGLAEPYTLRLDQVLVVPGGVPPAPVVAAAPTKVAQPAAATRSVPAAPATVKAPVPAAAAPAPAPVKAHAPAAVAPAPAPVKAPAPVAAAAAPSSSGAGPTAANIAMKYIGWAYVWGGTSPGAGGFDCSGLTYYAFRQAGRAIPRDLWGQLSSGARVSRANLLVGDLVFFQNTYTYGLSHVGIYVGGGRFVHAGSEHSGILTSSLNDPYWSPRYYGGVRP